jgi:DNA-binding PadR family transcriptional regulator
MQGLRWGASSAQDLVAEIGKRTRGHVRIHPGLIYKTLEQLVARRLVRRLVQPVGAALYELTALGRRRARGDAAAIARLFVTR